MDSHTTNERLMCRWVPVTGEDGRTRMEARWAPVTEPVTEPVTGPVTHPHAA